MGSLFASFRLLDVSGVLIVLAELVLLVSGVLATIVVRARYGSMETDLRQNGGSGGFETRVLNEIVRDALTAVRAGADPGSVNTQAIIEHRLQTDLRGLFVGERFVKATAGLLIILGLVGTFYGLTTSIGKLVHLVSADPANAADVTQSLMLGLTDALSGMSVAFLCSLFGIVSAIVMTLLGVFLGVADRRTTVMAQIESYLDNVVLSGASEGGAPSASAGLRSDARTEHMVRSFGEAVGRLEGVVGHFEGALQGFATNTRDFREFNHHLKDNIQRMSLSFADLSEALKQASRRDGR